MDAQVSLSQSLQLGSNVSIVQRNVSVIVIDGVTLGHLCCAASPCFEPFANNRDHFCPTHRMLALTCRIKDCRNKAVGDTLAYHLPSHANAYGVHKVRGQGRFQLKHSSTALNVLELCIQRVRLQWIPQTLVLLIRIWVRSSQKLQARV